MSDREAGRRRRWRGRQTDIQGRQRMDRRWVGRLVKGYIAPTVSDPTTCEVYRQPVVATRDHPAEPGHRCGLPITHRGQVGATGKFTFPLCSRCADEWPLPVEAVGGPTLDATEP